MPGLQSRTVRLVACAAVFLLLHGICNIALDGSRQAVSYLFTSVAPLLAVIACLRAARAGARQGSTAWSLLAAALALWLLGMLLSSWEDLTQQVAPSVSFFSDFAYFMYGAPILLAISSQTHDRRSRIYLFLDGVLVTLAAYLTYALIFSISPFVNQAIEPIPIGRLVFTYHMENLVLACGASLRWLAGRHAREQRAFYGALTLFLWAYALLAGLYNELSLAAPDVQAGLRDLLVDCPFLLLAVAVLLIGAPTREPPDGGKLDPLALFIENFSPIFFNAALLGLGFALMRQHFALGMGAIFVTLAVQSLRSALLQSRYMRSERNLREARDKLEKLSQTDALTGVGNRRHFDQMLELEWQRAKRNSAPLALLMIDIDHFKSLNDTFGHPYGDACLVRIAQALRAALPRSVDLLARYGGEEFAAILPGTEPEGALLVAAKMREAVAREKIGNAPTRGGWVTVSIGVACYPDFVGADPGTLVTAADHALYQAKQGGRDCAILATMESVAG